MKRSVWCSAFISLTLVLPALALEQPKDRLLHYAIKEYNAGRTDHAFEALLRDLKENPDSPEVHYYLGMALKKLGQSENSVSELEAAIKFCPEGALKNLASDALAKERPAPNWLANTIGFMTGKPPDPANNTLRFPDFSGNVHNLMQEGRKAIKGKRSYKHYVGEAAVGNVMPMGELLDLADQSHTFPAQLQSNPQGVMAYEQAPEGWSEWDRWILRFSKAFTKRLLEHAAREVKDETGGFVAAIFSVDKQGNLRGAVYQSTADDTLNHCVVETIKELDKSYLLAFPANTRVTGWNFSMDWNFKRALALIHAYRKQQADALAAALKQKQAQLETKAVIKPRPKLDEKRAVAKKLPKEPAKVASTSAKLVPSVSVKTNVAGLILPKAKPEELKATAMKLEDRPPLVVPDDVDVTQLFH